MCSHLGPISVASQRLHTESGTEWVPALKHEQVHYPDDWQSRFWRRRVGQALSTTFVRTDAFFRRHLGPSFAALGGIHWCGAVHLLRNSSKISSLPTRSFALIVDDGVEGWADSNPRQKLQEPFPGFEPEAGGKAANGYLLQQGQFLCA